MSLLRLPPGPDREAEDGDCPISCDWGYCGREQVGWARSDSDPAEEWLPICGPCSRGDFPEHNDEPFPVDYFARMPTVGEQFVTEHDLAVFGTSRPTGSDASTTGDDRA